MIRNKTIVLTGANGGIGNALAHILAENDNTLILMGRNPSQLEQLASSLPGVHHVITADLNSASDRNQAINTLTRFTGLIDIFINNAGISCFQMYEDMKTEKINSLLETNLVSPIIFTQDVMPLLNRDGAKIVNIGSTFGAIGYPGFSIYSASKFGLRGFSESLARELSDTHIRVQYIAPRATRTPINSDEVSLLNEELGNKMDEPSEVARHIYKTLTTNRTVTNFGWPEKVFVHLNSVLRNVVDHAISTQLKTIRKFARYN